MRALLAVVVFAVSAPVAANACGMRLREPQVNLAELMEDVDEAPQVTEVVKAPEAVLVESVEAVADAPVQVQADAPAQVEADAAAAAPKS